MMPALKLADAAERWVTVGQLADAGLKRRTITWACSHGDLQHAHRWRDHGAGLILEINLAAPTCPARYRQAVDAANGGAVEHGEAHGLTGRNLARAAKLAALLEEVEALVRQGEARVPEREQIAALLAGRRATDKSIPSVSSYYRLRRRWLASGRRLAALADGRADASGCVKAAFDEAAFSFFAGLYLTQDGRQASTCYEKLQEQARMQGWEVPSLPTVMRTLHARIPADRILLMREGEKAHRDRAGTWITRDWSQMEANECWVSDHCLIDVIGIDDLPGAPVGAIGRPARMWLTTWIDEACRYVVSWRIHRGPSARQVLAAFFMGIMAEGLPGHVRVDNGKDYRCQRFAGGRAGAWKEECVRLEIDEAALRPLLYDLQITPHFCEPYNARAKIVEPWHRHCIKEQFSKFVPGYCGGSPQEKPEQLAAIIRHWEKTGQGLLPWSTLAGMLAEVLEGYHRRAHEGLGGNCPAFVRQQKMGAITKRVPDERTAALFLEERLLTCGTCLRIDGVNYGLGNVTLIERQGEKVRVRLDEQNAGRAYVYDLKGKYLTTAENAGLVNAMATREEVVTAKKAHARHRKLARAYADSCANVPAIDPITALALQSQRGAVQPLPAGDPEAPPVPNFTLDFTPRADDGSRLPRLTCPAPGAATDGKSASWKLPDNILDAFAAQVSQRTDSTGDEQDAGYSLKNPWDILSAG